MRRTKLVATLGPATDAPGVLDALVGAGLDVARLNTSHATAAELAARFDAVRAAAERAGRHVAVMLDLGGPKIRLGEVAPGVALAPGAAFTLVREPVVGDAERASVSAAALFGDVRPSDRLLLDDGRIELAVREVTGEGVVTEVIVGGPLTSRKGVNVPGVRLSVDPLTDRDLDALAWGLEAGVDLVAQSFVRSASDIAALRAAMGKRAAPIVAKIEKHEAVAELDAIVAAADGVMVARGDLGVEIPPEQVPLVQRRIIAACREAGKPVIVATQMLESMTSATRPTRAEASDVANAIFDAVDAVMLSAETAIGAHPTLVVETMARIARTAESAAVEHPWSPARRDSADVGAAVSAAVCELASRLDLAAIVTATQSGATARAVASHRPGVPIVAATSDAVVARRLALVWGVVPVIVGSYDTIDRMIELAAEAVLGLGIAEPGQLVAVTGGVAVHVTGSTDLIQVHRL